jgi:hypothetical protein
MANMHLQHVALMDFVPAQYALPAKCMLHGLWSSSERADDFRTWANHPVWTDKRLASLSVGVRLISLEGFTDIQVWIVPRRRCLEQD